MNREEAAVKTLTDWYADEPWRHRQDVRRVLAAADAHDLAHGVHRIVLDDATVERAAIALWVSVGEKAEDWVYYPPEDERKAWLTNHARIVLAAAVQEER